MNPDLAKALKEIRDDFKEMRASLEREFRKDNRDVKSSLDTLSKNLVNMTSELKEVQKENAQIRAENASLVSECAELRKQVLEHEYRILDLEQYSRNRNLEIKGIPASDDENLSHVLVKIGEAIGESISDSDIEVCHRVPTKNASQSNVLVQFLSRSKRDAVLEKAKETRFSTQDIGYAQLSAVYINEHLCPELKRLLGMTVAKKKEKNWRFVWTKGGKIFARKSESTRTLRVGCVSDLEKIN